MMTALASWLFAKSAGGEWLVRIEDLDAPRAIEGCAEDQLAALAAFGLRPDGEVVRQSRREALYDALFGRLAADGRVYPCRCSRREVRTAASAPHGAEPRYPGTCRNAAVAPSEARSWRFRVDDGTVEFADAVFGAVRQDVAAEVGDFVVRREGPVAAYAYQFAVVADDGDQRITQVVRGADLLDSTARQILLGRALGFREPRWAHVPILVSAQGGEKLSKRAGSRALADAVARGDVDAIRGSLLRTLGQRPGLDEARRTFDPAAIPRRREIPLRPYFGEEAAST